MHQNCTPTKTGWAGGQARLNGKTNRDVTMPRSKLPVQPRSRNCIAATTSVCRRRHLPQTILPMQSQKETERRRGGKELCRTSTAAFIGPSGSLAKKPIEVTPRNLHPLLTFPPLCIYTNKSLPLHPVLKCLSIYSLLPGLLKKRTKIRQVEQRKQKEKLGNLATRRRRGRQARETKGSVRCPRRRAPKQALYKHLQRVGVPRHS